jgi:hypothetical protein
MNNTDQKRMRELSSAIAHEQDFKKLLSLLEELNQLFERKGTATKARATQL